MNQHEDKSPPQIDAELHKDQLPKNTMTQQELDKILEQHKIWVDSGYKKGECANFEKACLEFLNFSNTNLAHASFRKANLRNANFKNTKLWNANFIRANLEDANFEKADLFQANLAHANLEDTNFEKADLHHIDLSNLEFDDTKLEGAKITLGYKLTKDTED
jgi:uncharacterized protein YjbI with pentapeptide repeats